MIRFQTKPYTAIQALQRCSYGAILHQMKRQSISLTRPNNEWLLEQVESEEYSSKSDVVNDLIRKERARQKEESLLRLKLIKGEESGFIDKSPEQILEDIKNQARKDGILLT